MVFCNGAGNQYQGRELVESIDRQKSTRAEIPARAQTDPVLRRTRLAFHRRFVFLHQLVENAVGNFNHIGIHLAIARNGIRQRD